MLIRMWLSIYEETEKNKLFDFSSNLASFFIKMNTNILKILYQKKNVTCSITCILIV